MRDRWRQGGGRVAARIGLWIFCGILSLANGFATAEDMAVIVSDSNPTHELSLTDLRELLALRRQFWSERQRVVLVLPPSASPARDVLLAKVYRMNDSELRRDWSRRLFAGEIPAIPSIAKDATAALKVVRRSAGAITVVPASVADAPGVRTLAIDGRLPGQRGYPLSEDPPRR